MAIRMSHTWVALAAVVGVSAMTLAKFSGVPAAGLLQTSSSSADAHLTRYVAGLEPERIGPRTLTLQPGSLADANGTSVYRAPALPVDLDTVGAGGIDRGAPENGVSYQVYVLRDPKSDALSAIVSAAISYSDVALPRGLKILRKLNFGFVYDEKRFGGIPIFHFAYGPKGLVTFTGADTTDAWMAVKNGQSGQFLDVDLAKWLPDAARLARVLCITSSDGTPGRSYLHSTGAQSVGLQVGGVGSDPNVEQSTVLDVRVTSSRTLAFRTSGGARLTIVVIGYSMTEPS